MKACVRNFHCKFLYMLLHIYLHCSYNALRKLQVLISCIIFFLISTHWCVLFIRETFPFFSDFGRHQSSSSLRFWLNERHSYTLRTVRAWCSQSEFRIIKIRETSARALFLYNCTANILRSRERRVWSIHARVGLIHLLFRLFYFVGNIKNLF